MTRSVISYDKPLPEITGRLPFEKPTSHLVKDDDAATGWREDISGRRTSPLLLVPKIRAAVDTWRDSNYKGVSDMSRRFFEYWFEEDHEVSGFNLPFRYYFCQREAIETLVWLLEIAGKRDTQALIEAYGTNYQKDLISTNTSFQTTMDGKRQLRRYVQELERDGVQDLPPEDLRRFAFKMATGSGKTWVMAMTIVWSYFHTKRVAKSKLSNNFLIVAPNVIVYQRLEKDFRDNRIFYELPLIPPEWQSDFSQKVILRGDSIEPDPSCNLFLTNIDQLYESRDKEWTPKNAVDALLGRKAEKPAMTSSERSMLVRIKSLKDLIVMNDEAHHVHDEELAWTRSLLAIHRELSEGITAWLDFSATPKDQNGMYFPWTVVDYPLAQAVEDRIVKQPIIVSKDDDPEQPTEDPINVNATNVAEKYSFWIGAAVRRWQAHSKVFKKLNTRPVLFIMTEKNVYADALGRHLWKTKECHLKKSEVLIIHTNRMGEITKKDLDNARKVARDIDKAESKIKVIVSVMMLREGWDVRNVTVVLGLRPFTAKAQILPEQVIGRGLRLMSQVGPDQTQTLEVLGTRNLLKLLRDQLEAEGVGVTSTGTDPPLPVIIQPVKERLDYDIAIPITKPQLTYDFRKLSDLDVNSLTPIYDQKDLNEPIRNRLRMEFIPTETVVHREDLPADELLSHQELLAQITNKVIGEAKLPNRFSELYPTVRDYVTTKCFGKRVTINDEGLRSHLGRLELQEGIARYLAKAISKLTVVQSSIDFDKKHNRLSQTRPFSWRRNLPPLVTRKTVFNYVATYNDYERRFAEFLDKSSDILRFAALGTTEQGQSGTAFRIDYLKPTGAIGFYYPDWVAVQKMQKTGEINWIIETKGRIFAPESTKAKDQAITAWCKNVSDVLEKRWRYMRVDQKDFDEKAPTTLLELINSNKLDF